MENAVGPVLRTSDEVDAIAAAIEDDNPGVEIEMTDHGSYVRIHASGRLQVTEKSLKKYLGPDFELRELESMMPSFAGRITTSSDSYVWSLGKA